MKVRASRIALVAGIPLIAALDVCAQGLPAPTGFPPQPGAIAPAPAPTLGRLFYTPAQRAALDDMRKRPQAALASEQASSLPPAPEYVTLNGIVRRSDGATTVWLNDRQVRGRESLEGLKISPARSGSTPNHVTVVVPQTGRTVDLKVGQQLEVNSGTVNERYRSPPRPQAVAEAPPPKTPVEPPPRERRSGREREILRDLLDEIDRPAAPAASAPDAKSSIAPKP